MGNESKELRELQMQIALGLITDRDLWWALKYPDKQAPGEKVWRPTLKTGLTIFTHLIHRKYVIDPKCPDDVLKFIVERVGNGPKRT